MAPRRPSSASTPPLDVCCTQVVDGTTFCSQAAGMDPANPNPGALGETDAHVDAVPTVWVGVLAAWWEVAGESRTRQRKGTCRVLHFQMDALSE